MSSTFEWGSAGTVIHCLTTELNALANGTVTALGPEINNSSNYQMGQLYVHLASAAFVDPSIITIFFVPSSDTAGGAYPTVVNSINGFGNYLAATIYVHGSTAAQDEMFPYVTIPLGKFKVCAVTGLSCPTLAATGNTVDLYPTPTISA